MAPPDDPPTPHLTLLPGERPDRRSPAPPGRPWTPEEASAAGRAGAVAQREIRARADRPGELEGFGSFRHDAERELPVRVAEVAKLTGACSPEVAALLQDALSLRARGRHLHATRASDEKAQARGDRLLASAARVTSAAWKLARDHQAARTGERPTAAPVNLTGAIRGHAVQSKPSV